MFDLQFDKYVANIVIDRGERRNAVPMREWAKLEAIVKTANTSEARLIVFRSSDPNSFCAGSDLSELENLTNNPLLRKKFRGAMESVFKRIRAINKPTVCLIEGGCFGTGVSLAAACDLRVARSSASFAITPARFGISYPQADLRRLVELVGPGHAARLVYCCDDISGIEAERLGLVEVLDDSDAFGEATIARIIANAPNSLCALKATLLGRWGLDERFDTQFGSPNFNHGIVAFRDRKKPDYCNR